jgi:signal transduction histidine kinase
MLDPAREEGVDSPTGVLGALARVHEQGVRYAHGEDAIRLLDETLAAVMPLLHADGGCVHVVNAQTKPHVVVYRNCTQDLAGLCDSIINQHFTPESALAGNDLVIVEDLRTCSEPLRSALMNAQAVSFHWMPLLGRDREMLGAISTFSRTFRRPTGAERQWVKLLARHAADFMECRRAFQPLQQGAVRDRQARIQAEAANSRKVQFLAMLSHELRQPLAAALAAVEVQKHSPTTERRARAAEVIEQQLRQMLRLVDDLRDVTHVSQGTMRLHRERVDLRVIVRRAIEMTQARFNDKRHSMTIELCPDPAWVSADEARMTQVFSNLLQNAAAYTPPDGRIVVSLTSCDGHASFRLRDNGIGIPSDTLSRIFEAYQRGPQTNDSVGLGIGLAVVRRLVELHGGTVTAASDGDGQGSEFVVTLPAAPEGSGQLASPS